MGGVQVFLYEKAVFDTEKGIFCQNKKKVD